MRNDSFEAVDHRVFVVNRVLDGVPYRGYDCVQGHRLLSMLVDPGVTPDLIHCPDHEAPAIGGLLMFDSANPFPVRLLWRKATESERNRGLVGDGFLMLEWVSGRIDLMP